MPEDDGLPLESVALESALLELAPKQAVGAKLPARTPAVSQTAADDDDAVAAPEAAPTAAVAADYAAGAAVGGTGGAKGFAVGSGQPWVAGTAAGGLLGNHVGVLEEIVHHCVHPAVWTDHSQIPRQL